PLHHPAGSGGPSPRLARPSRENPSRLADLYQVPVGVAGVAADLASMVLRRREELGAAPAPVRVGLLHVRDADVEEAAHPVWVRRGLERDGWLVVGRPPADVDDDPPVR